MKKRFKRLGAMLLAGTMLLGATACGGGSNSSTTGNAAKSEDSASTTETGGTTSSGDIDTSEHVVITYMAVSYTHLDVYKRQWLANSWIGSRDFGLRRI